VDAAHPNAIDAITFNPLAADGASGTGLDLNFAFSGVTPGQQVELVVWIRGMVAVPQVLGKGVLGPTTGYMSVPLFTMNSADAGTSTQGATLSLDAYELGVFTGLFNSVVTSSGAAPTIPTLGFTLIGSSGASATVTVSNMNQITDGIVAPNQAVGSVVVLHRGLVQHQLIAVHGDSVLGLQGIDQLIQDRRAGIVPVLHEGLQGAKLVVVGGVGADQEVEAAAAGDLIGAATADDDVAAGAAAQDVGVGIADDKVVALAAGDVLDVEDALGHGGSDSSCSWTFTCRSWTASRSFGRFGSGS